MLHVSKVDSGPSLTVDAGTGDKINITPEDLVKRYRSSDWVERGFCSNCGSNLFYRTISTDLYNIPIDLFDDYEDATLKMEICYDQKPAYYDFVNETKKLTEVEIMKRVQAEYIDEKK
ncbi:hypothetical protein IGI42_000167 [Enterococcus sp. AZ109]